MKIKKLESLLLFDGIAIFFIIFFHELGGFPANPLYFLQPYLVFFGLTLFTFSAGYKLCYNHFNELNRNDFLSNYFVKRFIRLYKPYLGYSLLMLFPLYTISYVTISLNLSFEGATAIIDYFNNLNTYKILGFLLGENPIAYQLWYLVALITITGIFFIFLYVSDRDHISWLLIPLFIIALLIKLKSVDITIFPGPVNSLLLSTLIYLPFFTFGVYYAYHSHYNQNQWFRAADRYSRLLFPLVFFSAILLADKNTVHTILLFFSGILLPLFLSGIIGYVKKIRLIYSFFTFCGIYSFQIYLFQWPLCIPLLSRFFIDIMKLNLFFMPYIISIMGIFFCVACYKLIKAFRLNSLFE